MNPLLCVTVTANTTAELRQKRDEVDEADLVELRLDTVSDPSVAGALAGRRRPVIVTCRPTWEGGRFAGSEEDRRQMLADANAGNLRVTQALHRSWPEFRRALGQSLVDEHCKRFRGDRHRER